MEILKVNPKVIKANPYQPRNRFAPQELEELMASIRAYGIIQPLVVTRQGDSFELIAGERRLRASLALGLEEVPVVIQEHMGDSEKLELALIENIQRQDLNPIERAKGFRRLMQEFGLNHEEIAARLGKPRSSVTNTFRLLSLPDDVQRSIAEGTISEGHGKVLAAITDHAKVRDMAQKIIGRSLSVRALEAIFKEEKKKTQSTPVGDPLLQEQITALENKLSAKVNLFITKRENGKVVIDFFTIEELRGIMQNLLQG